MFLAGAMVFLVQGCHERNVPPLAEDSSLQGVVDALSESGLDDPDVFVNYEAEYLDDSFGTHRISCSIGLRPEDTSLFEQERMLRQEFIREPALITAFVTAFGFDLNTTPQEGALDRTEEVFTGASDYEATPLGPPPQ